MRVRYSRTAYATLALGVALGVVLGGWGYGWWG
jgi:hypothetical protein